MNLGSFSQIMASCKCGFYCLGSVLSSPRQKFGFENGNIKDVRNVNSTVHMYIVSICKLDTCLNFTAMEV